MSESFHGSVPHQGDALVIVDVQNDFLPGGSLAVPNGNEVIPVLNKYVELFESSSLPVIATRDWHPADHCSFKEQGGFWPVHCVAGTAGAELSKSLKLPLDSIIISKAMQADTEAYSGLDGTDLDMQLKEKKVERVFVGGLATDYCVLNTVKDFIKHGYSVLLLKDAVRAVNIKPDDGEKAEAEMKNLGAVPIVFEDLL